MNVIRPITISLAAAVLGVGLLATLLATYMVRQDILAEEVRAIKFSSDEIVLNISERLESYRLILRGAAALFEASEDVDREEWRRYVDKLQADLIVPGVQAIGLAQLIAAKERDAHLAAVRAEGFPDYQITPSGERDTYSAIIYLEPFSGRNLRAFGFDMFSEPVRRSAMETARDTGAVALSGKVTLVQETDTDPQAGILMYAPVYRTDFPATTPAQRQAALTGWAYSAYRMNDLMSGTLRNWATDEGSYLQLRIYDGPEPSPDNLLFSSNSEADPTLLSPFYYQRTLQFFGRTWTLTFDRLQAAPPINYFAMWYKLLSGLTISLLLFYLIKSLLNTRARAETMAQKLTENLRESQQDLQASEFRWRFAIEGAADGIWDWDVKARTFFFSKQWKEMLGFSDEEIGNGFDEWEKRVHPDDLQAAKGKIEACLRGDTALFSIEHRMLCKDGSYKWIDGRGTVVNRDLDGSPLRMIGTHRDIDETKTLEIQLRENAAELMEAQRIGGMGSWRLEVATGQIHWSKELNRIYGLAPGTEPPPLQEHPRFYDQDNWIKLNQALTRTMQTGEPYELELAVIADDGQQRSVAVRGEVIHTLSGEVAQIRGTVTDVTKLVAARLRIESLSDLYAALSQTSIAILQSSSEQTLLKRVCEIVVEFGRLPMAWIGMVDPVTGRVVPTYSAGEGLEYLEGIDINIDANDPRGRGPVGTAIRENSSMWIENFQENPAAIPWRSRALTFGWVACGSIPLCRNGQAIGALTFYSRRAHWFGDEVQQLLKQMALDIGFAIDSIDATARARSYQLTLVESEQRFQSLIEQSIVGAFIIQNDKIVYANPRMAEILGYQDASALQGLNPASLVTLGDRQAQERATFLLTDRSHATDGVFFNALRQDGSTVAVGVNTSVATFANAPAIIGTIQDISDRKVAEAQISRYAKQLEHTFMQVVGLANTLSEMRDPYTVGHERRVAQIAVAIGAEMGLPEQQLEGLRVGGYLHDVGKMKVPAEILAKPNKLTENEYALIKEHAGAGFEILKEVDFPWPVANIALQHHERMDGSGYPQGLKGEEIILEARIMAVADVIESMSSHRPYRAGLGIDKALEEIERGIGTLFDPVPARIALRLFREQGFKITDSL